MAEDNYVTACDSDLAGGSILPNTLTWVLVCLNVLDIFSGPRALTATAKAEKK